MRVTVKKSVTYNQGLNVSTLTNDISIVFSFKDRIKILFGADISFNHQSAHAGISTIDASAEFSQADLRI